MVLSGKSACMDANRSLPLIARRLYGKHIPHLGDARNLIFLG